MGGSLATGAGLPWGPGDNNGGLGLNQVGADLNPATIGQSSLFTGAGTPWGTSTDKNNFQKNVMNPYQAFAGGGIGAGTGGVLGTTGAGLLSGGDPLMMTAGAIFGGKKGYDTASNAITNAQKTPATAPPNTAQAGPPANNGFSSYNGAQPSYMNNTSEQNFLNSYQKSLNPNTNYDINALVNPYQNAAVKGAGPTTSPTVAPTGGR